MKHVIELPSGKIELEENNGHVRIQTDRLNARFITVYVNTTWADTDLAVDVNSKWLTEAYDAGQHKHREGGKR